MATSWSKVLRQIAVRVNAIGGEVANANALYAAEPLTSAVFVTARFPYEMCVDAAINAEAQIANHVANVANHPWRVQMNAVTAALASGALLPSTLPNGSPILGVLGSVRDSSDGIILSEKPIETIDRINNTPFYTNLPLYFYKISDQRIVHTRSGVVIDCCSYDAQAQRSQLSGNGDILFPDGALDAYVSGGLALLFRDTEYLDQAQVSQAYFQACLEQITQGQTSISINFAPSPQTGQQTV